MDMLKEMSVFVQVADSGGFASAARALGLTTSSVSRQVSRLEAHLGGRLLHRTTRAVALTELGEQAYAGCSAMLAAARDVVALAGSYGERPAGVLRISAPVVLGQSWLATRLGGFLAACPDVTARLALSDRVVDLVEDGFDLALRISDALPPGVAARRLGVFDYALVASPGYLRERGEPSTPQDLLAHACITLGHGAYENAWEMRRDGEVARVEVPTRASINNSAAIVAMLESGAGIGLVPDFAARASLAAGRLRAVLPQWRVANGYGRGVHLIYTPGRFLPLKVRAFVDYLVGVVGADGRL